MRGSSDVGTLGTLDTGAPAAEPEPGGVVSLQRSSTPTLDQAARELREIERRVGLDRMIAVGGVILRLFFKNDAAEWANPRRNKKNSIRQLADREDCKFGRTFLNDSVGVYVASQELPFILEADWLTSNHVVVSLRLPKDEREAFLRRAESERLTVGVLRELVVHHRRLEGECRGRPRATIWHRATTAIRSATRRIDEVNRLLASEAAHDNQFDELFEALQECLQKCADIQRGLRSEPTASATVNTSPSPPAPKGESTGPASVRESSGPACKGQSPGPASVRESPVVSVA